MKKENEILDLIFEFNQHGRKEEQKQQPMAVSPLKTKTAKHAVKHAQKQSDLAKNKKGDFESPYRHYKLTTTLKPIGYEISPSQNVSKTGFKGL